MRAHCFVLIVIGILSTGIIADSAATGFDLDAYQDHLETTRDLDPEGLLSEHEPFGPYRFRVPDWCEPPAYLDEIDKLLHLTEGERTLLERHGFVVSERWPSGSYAGGFEYLWMNDLPVFISTDAILHAVHRSYDELLVLAERRYLYNELDEALALMRRDWPTLQQRYRQDPRMEVYLNDIDVYVTVGLKLLWPDWNIVSKGGNDEMVRRIVGLIHAEQPARIALFNETVRDYDFSQFRPRAHYVEIDEYASPSLEDYFRTMMWMGRTEFRLTPPYPDVDVTREIIDACLLAELAVESGAFDRLKRIDHVIRTLVGPQDNLTIDGLTSLTESFGLESCDSLLDPEVMERFLSELAAGDYGTQFILSQIMYGDVTRPESVRPPQAFLPMGQRFLIDSFVAGQVVWPFVEYCGPLGLDCRLLPDPLDVLYCLGNDDALPFLEEQLKRYDYASNLSALRYIIDSQGSDVWQGSLYNSWLQAIRTLSKSGRGENVPVFMQTGAWQQEKMNTQLAAWAEIRHDNLLYGKQSYSGVPVTCDFPRTYVEPIPAFYEALEHFAEEAGVAFSGLPGMPDQIRSFFVNMKRLMGLLREISEKELDGRAFTDEEKSFLQAVIYRHEVACEDAGAGWYRELFFGWYTGYGEDGFGREAIIADVHTDPAPPPRILHVATGYPELGIFVAAACGYPLTAYIGPVASYHEHVTYGFNRLTDQEWESLYRSNPPARPNWKYVYLADKDGNIREDGRLLVTQEDTTIAWADSCGCVPDSTEMPSDSTSTPQQEDPEEPEADPEQADPELGPTRLAHLSITPNPATRDVFVSLRLDEGVGLPVRMNVLDSRGARVREIHNGWLPPQLAHFRWDGKDGAGRRVGSGVYFLRIEVGDKTTTRKITILR